jgi:hypothetical protein
MKNFIILSVISLLFSHQGSKIDYIRFEYVGSADKPMSVIYISESMLPDSDRVITIEYDYWTRDYVVSNNEFQFIERSIKSTTHKMFEEVDNNGFKITIRKNDTAVAYFITRKNSNALFPKVNRYLSRRKEINKELIHAITLQKTMNVFDY